MLPTLLDHRISDDVSLELVMNNVIRVGKAERGDEEVGGGVTTLAYNSNNGHFWIPISVEPKALTKTTTTTNRLTGEWGGMTY